MNTLLLLSFSLLCLREVTGLHCNICTYAQGSKCITGKGTCRAKRNEACASVSYFKGNIHLYSKQLCKANCLENYDTIGDETSVTMCCNKNLCNTF